MDIKNFRGIKKVYMVTILEGQGTEESVYREVHYIYDDDEDKMIGKIDPASNQQSK